MFGPYSHGWMFDGGGGMLFGVVWMILFWSIPILLIFALLKYLFFKPADERGRETGPQHKSALNILKEAYARGEIGRDEYLQKRDDLLDK